MTYIPVADTPLNSRLVAIVAATVATVVVLAMIVMIICSELGGCELMCQ
jgi:hypothetical protein